MAIQPEDLEYGHYYVAEVAINYSTPIVRAVASEAQPGNVLIMLTGPGFQGRFDMRTLAHFEVLLEIESMDPSYNKGVMPAPPKPPPVAAKPDEATDKNEPAEAEAE